MRTSIIIPDLDNSPCAAVAPAAILLPNGPYAPAQRQGQGHTPGTERRLPCAARAGKLAPHIKPRGAVFRSGDQILPKFQGILGALHVAAGKGRPSHTLPRQHTLFRGKAASRPPHCTGARLRHNCPPSHAASACSERGWPLTAWPGWDEGYPPPETNTVRPHPASSRRHAKTTKAPARAGRFRQPFMIPPKIWFHPYAIRRTGNKKPAKKQGSQPEKGRRQGVSVPHRRFKATAWRKARQARFA